jgi:hypothetical protein
MTVILGLLNLSEDQLELQTTGSCGFRLQG